MIDPDAPLVRSDEPHDVARARALLARYAAETVYKILREEYHDSRDDGHAQTVTDRIRREVLDKLQIL